VAEQSGAVVGALEVRGGTHVALLFVAPAYQRQGVGRGLLSAAFGMPEYWPELTVNSTPGAVCAYARLGFRPVGPEEEQNGLRFQAMRRPAREESFGSSAPAG
jgi:GNAT superfamily N-acetyltransferase